ncbi:IS630 transposase-related protein [Candidatus Tisiphia endosymbiont of Hybos culiciformis]|uniref:IS630 transposase-related protein n=1 Tax=Candidatus Tisiphia endosymbiont of Hybos culiciformis TaxID=3139331 RepID=UPI003CCAA448
MLQVYEIAKELDNVASIMTISRALKKLNITRKKRHMRIKKEMKESDKIFSVN